MLRRAHRLLRSGLPLRPLSSESPSPSSSFGDGLVSEALRSEAQEDEQLLAFLNGLDPDDLSRLDFGLPRSLHKSLVEFRSLAEFGSVEELSGVVGEAEGGSLAGVVEAWRLWEATGQLPLRKPRPPRKAKTQRQKALDALLSGVPGDEVLAQLAAPDASLLSLFTDGTGNERGFVWAHVLAPGGQLADVGAYSPLEADAKKDFDPLPDWLEALDGLPEASVYVSSYEAGRRSGPSGKADSAFGRRVLAAQTRLGRTQERLALALAHRPVQPDCPALRHGRQTLLVRPAGLSGYFQLDPTGRGQAVDAQPLFRSLLQRHARLPHSRALLEPDDGDALYRLDDFIVSLRGGGEGEEEGQVEAAGKAKGPRQPIDPKTAKQHIALAYLQALMIIDAFGPSQSGAERSS